MAAALRAVEAGPIGPVAAGTAERLRTAAGLGSLVAAMKTVMKRDIPNKGSTMSSPDPEQMAAHLTQMNEVATRMALNLPAPTRLAFQAVAGAILQDAADRLDRMRTAGPADRQQRLAERSEAVARAERTEARDAAESARRARETAARALADADTPVSERPEARMRAASAEQTATREAAEARAAERVAQGLRAHPSAPVPADVNVPKTVEQIRQEQARLIGEREQQQKSRAQERDGEQER